MTESHSHLATDPIINFCLHLADNSLIMGHRLSEWTGHGPMLEQDIAISNIALDLIGQSRNFYQYAAGIINTSKNHTTAYGVDDVSEDTLAYFRDAREFRNFLITELPNGDWAKTTLKLFLFSTYQYFLYQKMVASADKQLRAIAEKSLKEVTYHLKWSSEWVIRLGDGTDESSSRLKQALEEVWPYTGEMFEPAVFENEPGKKRISVPVSDIKGVWQHKVQEVFSEAMLAYPEDKKTWMQSGGKNGIHSEHLGFILAEMQFLQRAYPGCEW
ncbi:MAG: 1,2-phenylacetyl-CoA epoxidase subunit PaaC [Ginsengibacter sp.]